MAPILAAPYFQFYDLFWSLALPLLRCNKRLKAGYAQRILRTRLPATADVWIQAASVGESFLAWEILKKIRPKKPLTVQVTTNTEQGLEILQRAISEIAPLNPKLHIRTGYFPFDKPGLMRKATRMIAPRLMVLLETELWPAHLAALKDAGATILLVNGRITEKSLKRYLLWPSLWRRLRPDRTLAVSEADARRFGQLFGPEHIAVMPNIKFDRLEQSPTAERDMNPLTAILPADKPLLVLGSVREQEEAAIQEIILAVQQQHPTAIVALFPRHLHRLAAWRSFLEGRGLAWRLRSQTERPVNGGTVVLWDTFGELASAYCLASAAFVGGTLAPLGGQNFLEPLTSGIRPVIGPSWETFHWVGNEIIDLGLIRIVEDWREAAQRLNQDMAQPVPKDKVRRDALLYIQTRQGGTALACETILSYLQRK
jgi:3-deoxy-D-manno-octulosonic-acid transferase